MTNLADGMLSIDDIANPQKYLAARAFIEKYGMSVLCTGGENKKPLYLMTDIRPLMPLKDIFLEDDPVKFGFALIYDFAKFMGPEKSIKMYELRKQTVSLLEMQAVAKKELDKSLDDSFSKMKDLLSQMGNFNNV